MGKARQTKPLMGAAFILLAQNAAKKSCKIVKAIGFSTQKLKPLRGGRDNPSIGLIMSTGLLGKLVIASNSTVGFRLAWKRLNHLDHGHPFDKSERIDKLTSEAHPHSDSEYVYTVNIRKCNDCGLIYHDNGLEFRR